MDFSDLIRRRSSLSWAPIGYFFSAVRTRLVIFSWPTSSALSASTGSSLTSSSPEEVSKPFLNSVMASLSA